LWAERTAVFHLCATTLAGMLHVFEASAQQRREQPWLNLADNLYPPRK
jgi:hypothetical protein